MSTSNNNTTLSTTKTINLNQHEKAKVRANYEDLKQCLTPPGIRWQWSKSNLPPRLKHYFRHHNLIESDADGWQTTEDLWIYVISIADDDEDVGDATGQQHLLDEPIDQKSTQRMGDLIPQTPGSRRQITIDGDDVVNISPNLIERNIQRGQHTGEEKQHPQQTKITDH